MLEAAAAQGQLIIVQKLLEAGAHPDHSGEGSGATPLIAAADTGHIEICKALLQSGADVSISKSYWDDISVKEVHCLAVASAGETSNITLLELFLGLVEDADEAFDQEDLNVAVAEGRQKDSARLLRTRGFLDRSRTSINNALVKATETGNMLVLQRLLDAGADITAQYGVIGPNAIATAASWGHMEAMNKLLQAGSDQDNLSAAALKAALQSAVDAGNTAFVEPLLQAGADTTEIDIREAAS